MIRGSVKRALPGVLLYRNGSLIDFGASLNGSLGNLRARWLIARPECGSLPRRCLTDPAAFTRVYPACLQYGPRWWHVTSDS
jgi:hypothetical protein